MAVEADWQHQHWARCGLVSKDNPWHQNPCCPLPGSAKLDLVPCSLLLTGQSCRLRATLASRPHPPQTAKREQSPARSSLPRGDLTHSLTATLPLSHRRSLQRALLRGRALVLLFPDPTAERCVGSGHEAVRFLRLDKPQRGSKSSKLR
jgi:hypothetical protein